MDTSMGQNIARNRLSSGKFALMGTPNEDAAASGRGFVASHPWINFRMDLRSLGPGFWSLLGESRSKCRHLANTPMKPNFADELRRVYLAKGVHATTAIEGNTLTEEQAQQAVDGELKLPPSQEYLQKEIENVLDAINGLERDILTTNGQFDLNVEALMAFNLTILHGTKYDEEVVPGEIRGHNVGVGRYRAPEYGDCEYLLHLMCEWLNGPDFAPVTDDPRQTYLRAICRAVAAHVYLAWIHPFGDGNGRVARLVEFGALTEAGLPSVAAHLLSNHYNATRSEYYRQLDRASKSGELTEFLCYAIQGFVDQLQAVIDKVHMANLQVSWQNYVHECFHDHLTVAGKRQRDLVLALSHHGGYVRRAELRTLTPELAAAYADKQAKTITRDLNRLEEFGLILRSREGIKAHTEMMLQFIPKGVTDGALD